MALDLAPTSAKGAARVERSKSVLAAVLDVGAAKTVCLAAPMSCTAPGQHGRPLDVIGAGLQHAPANGKSDFDFCARSIRIALDEAERGAETAIHQVVAAFSSPGLTARIERGEAKIRNGIVTVRDAQVALAAAIQAAPSPGRAALHVAPLSYFVDDGPATPDPRGQKGRTLRVETCIVTAPSASVHALRQCIRAAGIEPAEVVAAPYAAALGVTSEEERQQGVLVVDLGAGGTTFAVLCAEGLSHAEHVAIGGARLTRDLAKKLGANYAAAERAKLLHGVVAGAYDPREAIEAPRLGADGRLESQIVAKSLFMETLAPRFQEMMLLVRARLKAANLPEHRAPQRAIITGGGAQIPGARELAQDALGLPVRIGRPIGLNDLDVAKAGPGFATAAGLLRWRLDRPPEAAEGEAYEPTLKEVGSAATAAASRAWSWLKENF